MINGNDYFSINMESFIKHSGIWLAVHMSLKNEEDWISQGYTWPCWFILECKEDAEISTKLKWNKLP